MEGLGVHQFVQDDLGYRWSHTARVVLPDSHSYRRDTRLYHFTYGRLSDLTPITIRADLTNIACCGSVDDEAFVRDD